jgi:two-component system, NtrC family, response regulator AtoC
MPLPVRAIDAHARAAQAQATAGNRFRLEQEHCVTKPLLLVVDDDDSTRRYLSALLCSLGYEVDCAESGEQALERLAQGRPPAVVLLDLILPGMSGLDALDCINRDHPEVVVVALSTVVQIKTVVDAVRRGASDYLTKPFREQELELTLRNVLEKQELKEEVKLLRRRLDPREAPDFVSANPRMLRIKEIARQVADTDAPVLLLGESGVGKEVVARYVHGQSRRRGHSLVKINCAALPQELLESELFGYERGAFSGAHREKPGMFELAHRGSILLDEIGEMSPHLQAKLLHVLQDGEYTRLGGRQPLRTDARVLASTNARLDQAVASGRFREDLYFRLNVIRLEIPPLRHRRDDIPLLCAHFLQAYSTRYESSTREIPRDLQSAFLRYHWPGNIRELENAVRRYVILPDVEMALAHLSGDRGSEEAGGPEEACLEANLSLKDVGARAAERAEQRMVRRMLQQTRWNRKKAAARLKISYKALLNKLKKWEIDERVEPRERRGQAGADEAERRSGADRRGVEQLVPA